LARSETRRRELPFHPYRSAQPKEFFMDTTQPQPPVSQLGESLAQAGESHRVLIQEIAGFAKDESLRFVNLRLERNGAALDKLQHCQGIPGLLSVQQEWLRDFVQDYIGQNVRVAGAFRGLAQNAMASAGEAVSDNIDRVQQEAGEMVHSAAEQTSQMAQDADNFVQEPLH
jgi:hypothetical protein